LIEGSEKILVNVLRRGVSATKVRKKVLTNTFEEKSSLRVKLKK
jgi:hypothetical protein